MSSPRLSDDQLRLEFGRRLAGGFYLFQPGEYGYHCPGGHTGNRITWSEFNAHLWCDACDKDYHYAQDCYLIKPEWMKEPDFLKFVAGLPETPEVRPGSVPGVF